MFNSTKKAKHYIDRDVASRLSWCKIQVAVKDHTTVILTEDVLSAIRCNRILRSCALLGTNISDNMVRDLLRHGYKNVWLALDPDALFKPIELKKKWGLFFNTFRVISLTKDPKDLSHDKLLEELTG